MSSVDGQRLTAWYREDDPGKRGKRRVVVNGQVGPPFHDVSWRPRIREDGAVAGYVALAKDQLWWKVVSLR